MPYLKYSKNEAIVPKVHFSVPEVYQKNLYLRYIFTTKKSTKKDSPGDIHQSKIDQKFFTTKDSRAKIQPEKGGVSAIFCPQGLGPTLPLWEGKTNNPLFG
jgi:hypothetical protein